ncbi:hypothetical protein BGZ73_006015 [Actinomortierella ambigua]|nr:hypothetical protein BGZ73_006015 [Actinomortierella ambigua]
MSKARSPDSRPWDHQVDTRRAVVPSAQAMNTAKNFLDLHKHQQQQVHLQHQRHQQQLQQQKELAQHTQLQNQSMLIKLINAKDVLPYVLVYLDTRSLLALATVNSKIRREILKPPVPALNALRLFLETRTVTCPMAMFESLKDFISRYRSFRPAHLHFTYSARLNLSSITPSEPIYNSKNDASLVYPSGSPLPSANSQVGIHMHVHGSLTSETAHENDYPSPQQLVPESSRTASSESVRSCSSYCNDLLSTKISIDTTPSPAAGANSSNIHDNSSIDIGKNVDLAPSVVASSSSTGATTAAAAMASSLVPYNNMDTSSSTTNQQEEQQQSCLTTSTVSNGTGSNVNHVDAPNILTPIPVLNTSATPRFKGHGFELSYWQKFALNELFLRSLPFLRTLTIGRTDKPTQFPLDEDAERTSMELATGVCYFLARCFNVMHDMPDTALESVIWMDVTSREVVLLAAMIELRDIVVDERYWRRGYWTWNSPSIAYDSPSSQQLQRRQGQDENGGEGLEHGLQWEGFYYLLYQDEKDNKPLARRILPPAVSASMSASASATMLYSNSGDRRLSSPPATLALGITEDMARIEPALNVDRGSVPLERTNNLVRAGSSPDTRTIARLNGDTVSLDAISLNAVSSSSSQDIGSSWTMANSNGNGVGSSSMHELSQPGRGSSYLAGSLSRQPTLQHYQQSGTAAVPASPDTETDLAVLVYKELRRRVADSAPTLSHASKRLAITNGSYSTSLCRDDQVAVDRKGKAPALQDHFSRLSIHS